MILGVVDMIRVGAVVAWDSGPLIGRVEVVGSKYGWIEDGALSRRCGTENTSGDAL